jgi:hypothetical protein
MGLGYYRQGAQSLYLALNVKTGMVVYWTLDWGKRNERAIHIVLTIPRRIKREQRSSSWLKIRKCGFTSSRPA